jgi:hypothetical protein
MNKIFYALPFALLTANSYASDARSYNIVPKNFNMVELAYSSVETEKELINTAKVDHDSTSLNLRYIRSFAIGDTLGAAYIILPYAKVDATANIGPMKLREQHSSVGDAKFFVAVGTYNMPALSVEEFKKLDKNATRSACSALMTVPTGEYAEANLFNIGSNLYSLKGECIVSYTQDKFQAEFITGVTTYSSDTNNAGTRKRTQKDSYQTEIHLTYSVNPKFWAGVDYYYQNGGEQLVNGISAQDKMNNSLVGLVGSYNIGPGRYLKANYLKTINSPRYAAKSDFLIVSVQQMF